MFLLIYSSSLPFAVAQPRPATRKPAHHHGPCPLDPGPRRDRGTQPLRSAAPSLVPPPPQKGSPCNTFPTVLGGPRTFRHHGALRIEHHRCRCCAHAFSPEKITGVHPRRGANALLAQPSRPTSRLPASVMTMGDPTPIEVLEGTLPPTPEAMVADAAATALFNPCGIAATPDGMQGCADRMPASGAHDPQAACVTHH